MTQRYLTTKRIDAVTERLGETDHAVIDTMTTVRLASGSQLRRLHYPETNSGASQARRRLRQLEEWQVLQRLPGRRVGGQRKGSDSDIWVAGPVVQHLRGHPRRAVRVPSRPYVAHAIAVTDTYVRLSTAERAGLLNIVTFEGEPAAWRPYTGRGGQRLTLKPDAYVAVSVGHYEVHAYLEIDLSTEHPGRVTKAATVYLDFARAGSDAERLGVLPRAIWLVSDQRRREQLRRALLDLPNESGLLGVELQEDLVDVLTAGSSANGQVPR